MHIDICLIPVVLTVALNNIILGLPKECKVYIHMNSSLRSFWEWQCPISDITMKSSRYKKGLNVRKYVEDFEIIFNSGFYSFIVPIFLIWPH